MSSKSTVRNRWIAVVAVVLAGLFVLKRHEAPGPVHPNPGPRSSSGNTYYLDTTNPSLYTNSNPCTFTQPCATLAHVNTLSLPARSAVYLKAGSHFYETLTPPGPGITYSSYGIGPQPIIDASQPITTSWTQGTGIQKQESQPAGGFASGFEKSGFSDWTLGPTNAPTQLYSSTATLTQSTTFVHNGVYAAMLTGDGTANTVILPKMINAWNANNTYWMRVYINVPATAITPNTNIKPLTFNSGYNDFLSLAADSRGYLTSVGLVLGGNYVGGGTTSNLADGSWHYIDVGVKPAAAAPTGGGGGEVWVDTPLGTGTAIFSNYSSVDTSSAAKNTVIQLGNTGYGPVLAAGKVIYFDDFLYNAANGRAGPTTATTLPGVPTTAWATPAATNPLGPLFGAIYGHQVSSVAGVINPYDWYWDSLSNLYVYGTTNPGSSVSLPTLSNAAIVSGSQNITFNNIDFRGAANVASGYGQISLTGNVSGFTMTNSTCEEAYASCLQIYEGSATVQNVTIGQPAAGNLFQNNGGGGVNFNVANQLANYVGYNTFTMNCLNSYSLAASPTLPNVLNIDLQFCGMFKSFSANVNSGGLSWPTGGQGTVIEWNVATSSAPSIPALGWAGSAAGIWPDTVVGYTVRYNTISGMFSSGVRMEKTGTSVVYGNTIFNNDMQPPPYRQDASGIDVICSESMNSNSNQIFNNSIFGSNWGMSAASDQSCNFSNNTFTNNIMTGSVGGTELYVTQPADNTMGSSGNTYTYNNFGPEIPGEACFIVYGAKGCQASYDAFDMAVGSSTHSIHGDPMFTSPSTGNLTLQTGSPAIGAATTVNYLDGSGVFYQAAPPFNLGVQ